MERNENNHPAHPVRNFFYALWMLLLAAAVPGLFYGLHQIATLHGKIIFSACAVLAVLGILFGWIVPAVRAQKYRKR